MMQFCLWLLLVCHGNAALQEISDTNNVMYSYANQLERHVSKSRSIFKSDVPDYEKMVKVDVNDKLFFYWNVNDEFLDVKLVYKDHGWLGFGISTAESQENGLDNAEAIIGKPIHHDVHKYKMTGNDWLRLKKRRQHSQTLQASSSILQDETTTTLSFRKILEAEGEISVKRNGDNEFLFVVGETNSYHRSDISTNSKFSLALTLDLWGKVDQHASKHQTHHHHHRHHRAGSANNETNKNANASTKQTHTASQKQEDHTKKDEEEEGGSTKKHTIGDSTEEEMKRKNDNNNQKSTSSESTESKEEEKNPTKHKKRDRIAVESDAKYNTGKNHHVVTEDDAMKTDAAKAETREESSSVRSGNKPSYSKKDALVHSFLFVSFTITVSVISFVAIEIKHKRDNEPGIVFRSSS